MFHSKSRLRLGKKQDVARQMLRNLVTSILLYESVRTTRKRAKVVQPMVDRVIAEAKRKPAAQAIRSINRIVTDKNACRKVMEVLKQRYVNRSSGFTSLVAVGSRKGDGAQLVDLSLMDREIAAPKKEEKVKAAKTPRTKKAVRAAV